MTPAYERKRREYAEAQKQEWEVIIPHPASRSDFTAMLNRCNEVRVFLDNLAAEPWFKKGEPR